MPKNISINLIRTGLLLLSIPGITLLPLFSSPEPSQAAVTPGYNGKLVIYSAEDGDNDIYTLDEDASNKVNLTNNSFNDLNPVWSPGGAKIAFQSNQGGDMSIYTVNPDGSNPQAISSVVGDEQFPAWSPNGQQVMFVHGLYGNRNIYKVNADGTGQIDLTTGSGDNFDAQWSPDGTKIAFSSDRTGTYEIYVMNADGSNETRLTTSGFTNYAPKWSFDGSKIIYQVYQGATNDLYSMDPDGSNQTPIANTGFDEIGASVSISPNSTQIAFSRYNGTMTAGSLVVANIDGTNAQVFNYNLQGVPVTGSTMWSPDSSKIIFTGYTQTDWSVFDIYTVNSDGTNLSQLTTGGVTKYVDWLTIANTPPVANNDTLATAYETANSIEVLANDTDEEALSSANLTITVSPAHGVAEIVGSSINYTPDLDYKGSDQLTYQICDSFSLNQLCDTAVLSITVQSPDAPALSLGKIDSQNFSQAISSYTTTNQRPTFTGTTTPGATVTVTINSDPIILSTTASTTDWSLTPIQDIPLGQHTVTITATLEGEVAALNSFVLGITSAESINQPTVTQNDSTQPQIPQTGSPTLYVGIAGMLCILLGYILRHYYHHQFTPLEVFLPSLYPHD